MKRVAAVVVLAAVVFLATAMPAAAHNYLVDSTPAEGEVLTALPEVFSVTTNEAMLDLGGSGSGFGIEVSDSEGLYYGDGCVTIEGATMSSVAALGDPGNYTLVYQFVSADGHTLSDSIDFEWAPEGDAERSEGASEAGDCNGLYARGDGTDEGAGGASVDGDSLLWIGGALAAVVVAVVVTLLVLRRPGSRED